MRAKVAPLTQQQAELAAAATGGCVRDGLNRLQIVLAQWQLPGERGRWDLQHGGDADQGGFRQRRALGRGFQLG